MMMNDIELRKWCLEKAMAFVSDFRDAMIHGDDYAESYQEDITEAANDFYNWITANEEPTRGEGVKILSRSISKDCRYRYEDETDEEFKERIERNHELGLENPKICQPGDRKYNEEGFFIYYGDKNTPDETRLEEDVGMGCSDILWPAIDKSKYYYDYDENGKMTIKAFKPDLGFDPILLARIDEIPIFKKYMLPHCTPFGEWLVLGLSNTYHTAMRVYPDAHKIIDKWLKDNSFKEGMSIPNWIKDRDKIEELRELYKEEIAERLKNG